MPKQQTTVDFSEIFRYAKEKHGIHWNPCNDLFFRTDVIEYKGVTNFYPFDGLPEDPLFDFVGPDYDLTDEIKKNVADFKTSNEAVCQLLQPFDRDKLRGIAKLIINQFAMENNLSEFVIIGD